MILVLVMTFSCNEQKTEKAVEVENTEKPIEKSKKLVFDVDLETSSPDDFRFFANNIFLNNSQFMMEAAATINNIFCIKSNTHGQHNH